MLPATDLKYAGGISAILIPLRPVFELSWRVVDDCFHWLVEDVSRERLVPRLLPTSPQFA
jgi:hypothetical protein